jgi:hypothetical protein
VAAIVLVIIAMAQRQRFVNIDEYYVLSLAHGMQPDPQ